MKRECFFDGFDDGNWVNFEFLGCEGYWYDGGEKSWGDEEEEFKFLRFLICFCYYYGFCYGEKVVIV